MPLLVYMTAPDEAVAEKVAKSLLEKRLIACANILPGARSLYWWDGKVQSGREAVLIAKTTRDRFDDMLEMVLAIHPYECPCVVTVPLASGNPDFLQWIETSTRSE